MKNKKKYCAVSMVVIAMMGVLDPSSAFSAEADFELVPTEAVLTPSEEFDSEEYLLDGIDSNYIKGQVAPTELLRLAETYVDGEMLSPATMDNLWVTDENKDGISDNWNALLYQNERVLPLYTNSESGYYVAYLGSNGEGTFDITDTLVGYNSLSGQVFKSDSDAYHYDKDTNLLYINKIVLDGVAEETKESAEKDGTPILKAQVMYASQSDELSVPTTVNIEGTSSWDAERKIEKTGIAMNDIYSDSISVKIADAGAVDEDDISITGINGLGVSEDIEEHVDYDSDSGILTLNEVSPSSIADIDVKIDNRSGLESFTDGVSNIFVSEAHAADDLYNCTDMCYESMWGNTEDRTFLNLKFDFTPESLPMDFVGAADTGAYQPGEFTTASQSTHPFPAVDGTSKRLASPSLLRIKDGVNGAAQYLADTPDQPFWGYNEADSTKTALVQRLIYTKDGLSLTSKQGNMKLTTKNGVSGLALFCSHIGVVADLNGNFHSTTEDAGIADKNDEIVKVKVIHLSEKGYALVGVVTPTSAGQSGVGFFRASWEGENPEGELNLTKTSNNPNYTSGNAPYTLQGATYGVFTDSKATVPAKDTKSGSNAVLTTTSTGKSNTVTLPCGSYYVKETKAPRGYKLDKTIHPVKVCN